MSKSLHLAGHIGKSTPGHAGPQVPSRQTAGWTGLEQLLGDSEETTQVLDHCFSKASSSFNVVRLTASPQVLAPPEIAVSGRPTQSAFTLQVCGAPTSPRKVS